MDDLFDDLGNYIGDNPSDLVTNDLTGQSSGGDVGSGWWGSGSADYSNIPNYQDYVTAGINPSDYTDQNAAQAALAQAQASGSGQNWYSQLMGALQTKGALPLASAATGLLGSALSGNAQQSGINAALQQLQAAYGMASSTQSQQYDKSQAMIEPYRTVGTGVLPQLATYAAGQDTGRQTLGQMAGTGPQSLYQWQLGQTNDQINNQLAARGLYNSGAGLRTLTNADQQLAATQAQQMFANNLTLENMDYGRTIDTANLGMGAAAQGAGLATQQGNSLANTYTSGGTAQAQGDSSLGNARASMYSSGTSAVNNGLTSLYAQNLLGSLGIG